MPAEPAKATRRSRPDRAVLLTPGASATRDHHALVAMDAALSALGIPVERIDLPSRKRPPAVIEVIAEAAAALADRAGVAPGRVVLGGRSFGGRMCSMAVAEGLPALGLVLVSYPLHPPGRPDQLRTAHLPDVAVPCLFVSGTRDPFGTPGELAEATRGIPSPVEHVWIEGGDHGLRGSDAAVSETVARWVHAVRRPRASRK